MLDFHALKGSNAFTELSHQKDSKTSSKKPVKHQAYFNEQLTNYNAHSNKIDTL